jgi:NitT/TauT family transport system substrate-binding protein
MTPKSMRILVALLVVTGILTACVPTTSTRTDQPTPATIAPTVEVPTATIKPVHLKVGIFNYISYAPFFIAYEEGYFSEQGLDVELIDFGSDSTQLIPALLSKQLDIAPYPLSASVFNAILQGVNVKYVADKGFLNPNSCVTDAWVGSNIALSNGTLTDLASLRGKKVVSIAGGPFEYALDVMLKQAGLTQKDIVLQNIIDSATRVQALGNNSVDISLLSEPWITRALAQNAGTVWKSFAELIPNFSLGAVIYGPSIMEGDHDVGVRFMVAYLKAIQQFNQGKTDRNVEIIAKYTKLTPEEIKQACWTSFKPDAKIDSTSVLGFEQWTVDKGYVDTPLTVDQIIDNEFVDNANLILHP